VTTGTWNHPGTYQKQNWDGVWRIVGVISDYRSWSGGDCFPAVKRVTALDRRIKKWSILASSLAYATSSEAKALIRNYNRSQGSSLIKPGTFIGPDRAGRQSLHAEGLLSESLRLRDGLSGNSRPVKRKRFPTDNSYTVKRIVDRQEMMKYKREPVWAYPNGWYDATSQVSINDHNSVSLLTANDQLRLVNKLKEQLQGSDFNMSVFLGEGHQTLRMIGDTAIKLAHAGHLVRRGDLSQAASVLLAGSRQPVKARKSKSGTLASNWLELQYGWLPLLGDVRDGAQALAHQLNVPMRTTYRVKVNKKRSDVSTYSNGDVTYVIARDHTRYLTARISEFDSSVPALLGLNDPELVAWELLPFSFVADWIIPIGSYLEARALSSRLTGKFITGDKYSALSGPPTSATYGPGPSSVCRRTVEYFRGTPSTSLSVPMPNVKSLAEAASWQHCANGLALLTQVFTGSKVWSK
jgi:hypothetical protein